MNLEKLISINDLLIKKIASKFYNVSFDDLYQVGVIGLMDAYKHYKKDSNVKFSTYAYRYIFGEMYHYAISNRPIKISKEMLKMYKLIEETKYNMCQELKRLPSDIEIAQYLKIDLDTVLTVEFCVQDTISLDKEVLENDNNYNYIKDDSFKNLDNKILLEDSLNNLSDFEHDLIKIRYFDDYTQSETAKILGISQVKVSRYEKKLINKLRYDIAS